MRIVFDTNVILAAAVTRGASAEVFEYCLIHHQVCLSPFIMNEVKEKLLIKFRFPKNKTANFLRFLRGATQKVVPAPLPAAVCRDADDDNVLAAGVAAKADCILTGDSDLLDLVRYEGIPILKPADFWKFEKQRASQ